jgi:Tol biopolymer transport system component
MKEGRNMGSRWIIFIGIFILLFILINCKQMNDFPDLKGPYLGQNSPGLTPQLFAEGIVSTGASEFGSTFTPDGQEFYYAISGIPVQVIAFMKFQDGRWTQPQIPNFSGRYSDWDLNFSPDGKKLYFTSDRPVTGTGDPLDNSNLWVVEKTNRVWGKPRELGPPINTDGYENYPSVTNDGTLYYFHSEKRDSRDPDVYYSRLKNGKYMKPVRLGKAINSQYHEWDPFIAPDESFLIFGSVDRPGGYGGCDLYISFRKQDGSWTQAVNMGESINTEANEFCPNVTSDGKYLFFTSRRRRPIELPLQNPITHEEKMKMVGSPGNGEGDIYWVDAKIIEELKPDELK